MQSFLILSKDKQKRQDYLQAFAIAHSISPFDQSTLETEGPSIGIEEVRLMQKTLFLKPYQSAEKMVVITDAQKLTIEAQNALLKVLEEPPANTYLFVSAASMDTFLPTILSRCSLIFLEETPQNSDEAQSTTMQESLEILRQGSLTKRLVLAEKLAAEKEETASWFEHILTLLHTELLANPQDRAILSEIQALQEAATTIKKTNANPRLVLEHAFLSLLQ